MRLDKKKIHQLFKSLNQELKLLDAKGELYLVGGAVMCLVFEARQSTADIDAQFSPSSVIREAAVKAASKLNVSSNWLNDGVKGFLSEKGKYASYLELSNLNVMVATPSYMLAMKCLATRIGAEYHDIDDIRYLLRHLGIETYRQAAEIISEFYPIDRLPQKALYLLEELLVGDRPK